MDPLDRERRLRAFRAADAFAIETWRACRALQAGGDPLLAREMRRAVAQGGAALVAASGSPRGAPEERRRLEEARGHLLAGRYFIYLARRTGQLDVRGYRGLAARQDSALREIEQLLREPAAGSS